MKRDLLIVMNQSHNISTYCTDSQKVLRQIVLFLNVSDFKNQMMFRQVLIHPSGLSVDSHCRPLTFPQIVDKSTLLCVRCDKDRRLIQYYGPATVVFLNLIVHVISVIVSAVLNHG